MVIISEVPSSEPKAPARAKEVEQLLERLHKEDRVFDYNVPAQVRRSFSDDALLEYLDRTYAQKWFTIDEPQEVEKYMRVQDFVRLKQDYLELEWSLPTGTEGKIEGLRGKNYRITFDNNVLMDVSPDKQKDYQVIKRRKYLGFWSGSVIESCGEPPLRLPDLTPSKVIAEGYCYIKYIGAPLQKEKIMIPTGSIGIVFSISHDYYSKETQFNAAWSTSPRMVSKHQDYTTETKLHPKLVELLIQNFTDYNSIRREYIKE